MTEVTPQFKDDLLEWNELKKALDGFTSQAKTIRARMEQLKEQSIKFMESKGIDACNVDGGKSRIALRKVTRTIVDVKKSNLPDILLHYFKQSQSEDDARKSTEDIMKFIADNYSKSTESMTLVKTNVKTS